MLQITMAIQTSSWTQHEWRVGTTVYFHTPPCVQCRTVRAIQCTVNVLITTLQLASNTQQSTRRHDTHSHVQPCWTTVLRLHRLHKPSGGPIHTREEREELLHFKYLLFACSIYSVLQSRVCPQDLKEHCARTRWCCCTPIAIDKVIVTPFK